jgi:phosphoribosylaminoimidazole-succinocarboxamide synthase
MELDLIRMQLDRCLDRIDLPELGAAYRGKVRDCYTVGDRRLLVATDRVSAFDRVFETLIPFKGQVLNKLAAYFLRQARAIVPTHLIDVPDPNVTVATLAEALPVEVIVRGYLTGSAWRDYESGQFESLYGFALPEDLSPNVRLQTPILTPTGKATTGHDLPITRLQAAELVGGEDRWAEIERIALALYAQGSELAAKRGLILVDTKYEFGLVNGVLTLIDEVHTPDSSRYWYRDSYITDPLAPQQLSKEFLREWLRARGFTGDGPLPELPEDLRLEIAERYLTLYRTLTGQELMPAFGDDAKTRIWQSLQAKGYLRGGVVSILMGSASDMPTADKVRQVLDAYDVPSVVHVASAHKVPERVLTIVDACNHSAQPLVHITIAGRSNGLSGVTAANSVHPVIALPPFKDHADYLVNIHSSLQMPSDTPVLTVIDPTNAAMAALRILAVSDVRLRERLMDRIIDTKQSFGAEVNV